MSFFSKEEHITVVRKKGQKPKLVRSGDIMKPDNKSKLNTKIREFERKQRFDKQKIRLQKKKERKKKYEKLVKSIDKRASDITANVNDYYGTNISRKPSKKTKKKPIMKTVTITKKGNKTIKTITYGKQTKPVIKKKQSKSSYASDLKKNMDDYFKM